jgi:hypothetical protein
MGTGAGTLPAPCRHRLEAGLYLRGDRSFLGAEGAFRVIPGTSRAGDVVMGHVSRSFDRTGFQQDWNVAFPLDRLHEAAADGIIGRVADHHYSFMGATHPSAMEQHARRLAGLLKSEGGGFGPSRPGLTVLHARRGRAGCPSISGARSGAPVMLRSSIECCSRRSICSRFRQDPCSRISAMTRSVEDHVREQHRQNVLLELPSFVRGVRGIVGIVDGAEV